MKNITLCIAGIICMAAMALTSCKKQVFEVVDAEEKRLAGNYSVENYRVTDYDSMGIQLNRVDHLNYGNIELKMNTNEGSDVFSHFILKGDVSNSYIAALFRRGNDCGEYDQVKREYHLMYQCDPDKKRFMIAAFCRGQTLTVFTDYSSGGSDLKIWLLANGTNVGSKVLYEYFLKRN